MLRASLLCLTIVAAIELPLVAAPAAVSAAFTDAPVMEPAFAAAETLGLDPTRDRVSFLAELTRLLYTPPEGKSPAVAVVTRALRDGAAARAAVMVPVPLSADIWSRAVFGRAVSREQLVGAIVADRRAALLAHALAGLDDETLAFLAGEPDILARLYEHDAAPFAAFGVAIRVTGGRVVPPGGAAALPLWEAVIGEPVTAPARFLRALFGNSGGRIAYLYGTIAQLDAPAANFALGLWRPDPAERVARFSALAAAVATYYGEWRLESLPFSRPLNDLATLLLRIRVAPSGEPVLASRAFWQEAWSSDDLSARPASAAAAPLESIDAAWLVQATAGGADVYARGDRLDQFGFGQRMFADVDSQGRADALTAVRAVPAQRMLMLALERMGVKSPATFAAAARRAGRSTGAPSRAFWTLAQLQGALAMVARLAEAGTIGADTAAALVTSICAVPLADDRYAGALANWVSAELLPLLPDGPSAEARLIAGLAGPPPAGGGPPVTWEGQRYQLNFPAAEVRRLEFVRRKQGSYTLDMALALQGVSRQLGSAAVSTSDVAGAVLRLTELSAAAGAVSRISLDVFAAGVEAPPDGAVEIARIASELGRLGPRDAGRAARQTPALGELVDVLLGEALMSMAYAASIGDPLGGPMLARNIALRHDFGLGRRDGAGRRRTPWQVPRPDFQPGVPWHITGSLLGLDLAFAPTGLQRISADRSAEAPRLASNQREVFAVTVVLMNTGRLRDPDLRRLADAVREGSRRVAALGEGREPLDGLAHELSLDGWRRQGLRAMLASGDRAGVAASFLLAELVTLGGGATGSDLDAWGMSAMALDGCMCTRLVAPRYWGVLSGRPQTAFLATAMSELNLHVALALHELGLPAALARPVLAAAVQDFTEQVSPRDFNDFWTLASAARQLTRTRIEDYVAVAAAVDGPLSPVVSTDPAEDRR